MLVLWRRSEPWVDVPVLLSAKMFGAGEVGEGDVQFETDSTFGIIVLDYDHVRVVNFRLGWIKLGHRGIVIGRERERAGMDGACSSGKKNYN